MNFSKIKVIVFDLGDVVINIDFMLTYKAFAELSGITLDEALVKFDELEVFDKYEKGLFSDDEFVAFLKTNFAPSIDDEVIVDAWNAILLDIPPARIDLMKELQAKYDTYILSNTSNIHIIEVNNILSRATGVSNLKELVIKPFYSYEMGLRKPSREIYNTMIDEIGCKPEEILFVDDNEANIISANEMGINAVLVTKENSILDIFKNA